MQNRFYVVGQTEHTNYPTSETGLITMNNSAYIVHLLVPRVSQPTLATKLTTNHSNTLHSKCEIIIPVLINHICIIYFLIRTAFPDHVLFLQA